MNGGRGRGGGEGLGEVDEGEALEEEGFAVGGIVLKDGIGLVVGIEGTATVEVDVGFVFFQTEGIPFLHVLVIDGGVVLQIFDVGHPDAFYLAFQIAFQFFLFFVFVEGGSLCLVEAA